MIDLVKLIENSNLFDAEELAAKAFNNFYARKYGSIEEAEKVFKKIKLECKTEGEFQKKKEKKIQSDIPLEQFEFLMKFINNFQSFSTIVNRDYIENSLINDVQNNPEKWKLVFEIMEDYFQLINEKLGSNKEVIKQKLIEAFNHKITFTIKETREELGFKNQQTFKIWLDHFYSNKYDNRRKFNLMEYIDVIKLFLLKPDEYTIDLKNNSEDYKIRLANGLIIKKADLKKFTNNNYKLLKNEIDDLKELKEVKLPDNVDFYPYSIAQLIIKYLT